MVAFHPFDSAENALENMNAITEHEMTQDLRVLPTKISKIIGFKFLTLLSLFLCAEFS